MGDKISHYNRSKYNKNMTQGKQNASFFTFVGIASSILILFLIYYMYVHEGGNSAALFTNFKTTTPLGGLADKSDLFGVKVLPASLSDKALGSLPRDAYSYLAMIDAGSSGCRAHVYRYGKLNNLDGPLYILPEHKSKKIRPGLSSFKDKPQDAGASLQGLVQFLKEEIPKESWKSTPIWVFATAGLRMLQKPETDRILTSVREYLASPSKSPFFFRHTWARVISGNEEGGFGWIAFNYLKKVIGPKASINSPVPYAVIEMGGASLQVSQLAPTAKEANQIPNDYKFSFTLEGQKYTLYTHSYLGYGAEQAREGLSKGLVPSGGEVKDPCLYQGYSRAKGSARKDVYEGILSTESLISGAAGLPEVSCMKSIKTALFSKSTDVSSCTKSVGGGPFSFDCVYQPAFVAQSPNILIFENFYYTSSALGIKPADDTVAAASPFPLVTTAKNFADAANTVCSQNWKDVNDNYPKDKQGKDSNLRWCFSASYAASFLIDGIKLADSKAITVQKEVGDSEIEWALGAAYKELADLLKRTSLRAGN